MGPPPDVVDDSVSMCSHDSEEQSRSESPLWAHWNQTSTAPSSPRTSIYSFASSVEKHLVTQTVHGRVLNNTNEVRAGMLLLAFCPPPAITDMTSFLSIRSAA